jgi:beta-glucosidase
MNRKMPAPKGRGLASGGQNKTIKFPEGFLWGAATSAHQVEGANKNDWTEWEKKNAERLAREAKNKWADWQQEKFPEMFDPENYISGQACDHYNRYEEDLDIAKSLNLNAFRISIEWSRIEPEEGRFNEKEIEHYRKVIKAIRARGMEPFVTLWHWTEPIWFEKAGGWTSKKSIDYFSKYVKKIVTSLDADVKFWIVINEPNVQMGFGYLTGAQPPAKKSLLLFLAAYFYLLKAYKKSYKLIHAINKDAKVGLAHSYMIYDIGLWKPIDGLVLGIVRYFSDYFVNHIKGLVDFVGVNYYTVLPIPLNKKNKLTEGKTDLGWEVYPRGIYSTLKNLKKYNLPIYITENGIADADDAKRKKFIKDHLRWIHRAIREGVDVRGYFHWSLLDNFEFPEMRGFWPRFGLVEVDYKNQKRTVRPSAREYAKICKNNYLAC